MESKLRMNFADFYESNEFLDKEFCLSGCIDYDLGWLFKDMVYRMLPAELPKNYYYDVDCDENGDVIELSLCLIDRNYPEIQSWLVLITGKFEEKDLNQEKQKIANDYFIEPLKEIIAQMTQYYADHDIEVKRSDDLEKEFLFESIKGIDWN